MKVYFKFRDPFDKSPHRFEIGNPIVYFGESDPSVSGQTGHQFDYRMMHI